MPRKENKEFEGIKIIINDALTRILSRKTKRTYQAELHIISKTIEDYIKITYISKEVHLEETLKQIFGYINQLKNLDNKINKKDDVTKAQKEGIKLSIKELEKNIYKK